MRDVEDFTGPVAAARLTQDDDDSLPLSDNTIEQPVVPIVLRQQTLFRYSVPTAGRVHERGLSKAAIDFDTSPQQSVHWGDVNVNGGQVDDRGLFRILSHNVNGLSTAEDQIDVRHFANYIREKAVSLFGIQETNRNFERPAVLRAFNDIMSRVSVQHKGVVASASLAWPVDYQPGGTAVSVRNQWATRLLDKGSDDLGRWSWLTLAGRGTTKITFISGYRVCDGAPEAPITARTVRAQQEWMYAARGTPKVNLRKQFISDLISLISELKEKGHDIVLMFDANEACRQGSGVDRLILSCGLVDAHTLTSDSSPPPPTHQRGSVKIDFVLISPRLVQAVRAASILPLHDGYLSDHRALMVDFDARALFESVTSPVLPPTTRRLTSTNPRSLHIYISNMVKHIVKHELLHRVESLRQKSENGQWTEADILSFEEIDSLLEQGRSMAESKCSPIRSGQFPWSPELDCAGKYFLYWQMRVRTFSSGVVNTERLSKLAIAAKISDADLEVLEPHVVRKKCRQAKKAFRLVKKDAASTRAAFMETTAKLSASLHNMSDAAAISAIAAREKSAKQFRQLRSIFKKGRSSGFDRLDIPDKFAVLREGEEPPRIPLVVKEKIEEVLLPHTEKRFRQHQETPFGNGARKDNLGPDCTSDDVQALRDGRYDRELETLSDEARTWLRHLKSRDFVNAGSLISVDITFDDWVSGWSRMRESTASVV